MRECEFKKKAKKLHLFFSFRYQGFYVALNNNRYICSIIYDGETPKYNNSIAVL